MQSLYSVSAVNNLIAHYIEKGGECYELIEGVLGYGLTVLFGDGLKTAVVQEVAMTHSMSGHKIRFTQQNAEKVFKNDR